MHAHTHTHTHTHTRNKFMQTRAVTCVSEEVISVDKDRTLQPKEQVGTHPQDAHTHMRAHTHADVQTCNLSYA